MNDFEFPSAFFFFSSRRRHTRFDCDWSSDVCSSDLLALQVVVEVVDLPLHAARILHPELILVGVAAVDTHLLTHWYACRFYAPKLNHHSVRRVHLDAHVVNRPLSATTALRQREVYRRPFGQEFDVAGFHLHWVAAEEPDVELSALAEVRDLHVDMDLRAHRRLLSSTR